MANQSEASTIIKNYTVNKKLVNGSHIVEINLVFNDPTFKPNTLKTSLTDIFIHQNGTEISKSPSTSVIKTINNSIILLFNKLEDKKASKKLQSVNRLFQLSFNATNLLELVFKNEEDNFKLPSTEGDVIKK
jgi:hypothetical protein